MGTINNTMIAGNIYSHLTFNS
ncbi:hypothetical protein CY0110_16842 [Crocosphaera chwakensis CCY0110]|uniref:Uncharacterized protein n=1 Tax=Crocosphaera chwakensis CCY0110 TaxID=391612 RepID=A3II50_9CHRO|nr:hypothetical protein CY0110_16842 [Crocosphaera chwakensis CCY0110]